MTNIGITRETLPEFLKRTRDIKPDVRCHAYKLLGLKVDIRALKVNERVQILSDGLKDR